MSGRRVKSKSRSAWKNSPEPRRDLYRNDLAHSLSAPVNPSNPENRYEVRGDDDNVYGPESEATIRRWRAENRLEDNSQIRIVGETEWRSLSAYEQFNIPASKPVGTPVAVPETEPKVFLWYRIYNGLMALMYVLLAGFFWWLKSLDLEFETPEEEMEIVVMAWVMLVVGLPLALFYLFCCFKTHRGWHWVLGFFSIGIGMTGCCLPVCIPLIIFWIKPETKAWLNRNES